LPWVALLGRNGSLIIFAFIFLSLLFATMSTFFVEKADQLITSVRNRIIPKRYAQEIVDKEPVARKTRKVIQNAQPKRIYIESESEEDWEDEEEEDEEPEYDEEDAEEDEEGDEDEEYKAPAASHSNALSEYEAERLRKIQQNQEFMKQLGISVAKDSFDVRDHERDFTATKYFYACCESIFGILENSFYDQSRES
jgi:hypothetical protein